MNIDKNTSTNNMCWKHYCKNCRVRPPEFIKLVNMTNNGIDVYYDSVRCQKHTENYELPKTRASRSDELAYILHNKGDKVQASKGFKSMIEPSVVNCPRCRRYLENAQPLLRNVTNIDKNSILGICNNCKHKVSSDNPCNKCVQAVGRFLEFKKSERKTISWKENLQRYQSVPIKYDKRFCLCGLGTNDDDSLSMTDSIKYRLQDIKLADPASAPTPAPTPASAKTSMRTPASALSSASNTGVEATPASIHAHLSASAPVAARDYADIPSTAPASVLALAGADATTSKPAPARGRAGASTPAPAPKRTRARVSASAPVIALQAKDDSDTDSWPSRPVPPNWPPVPIKRPPPKKVKAISVEEIISIETSSKTTPTKSETDSEFASGSQSQDIVWPSKPMELKHIYSHTIVNGPRKMTTASITTPEKVSKFKSFKFDMDGSKHDSKTASTQEDSTDRNYKKPKGIFNFTLSDKRFIHRGWTALPTEKVMRQMYMYSITPSNPEFDWFKLNKNKGIISYDTGEDLANTDPNGHGQWFYKNGNVALDYYENENLYSQQRVIVYSSGEPDDHCQITPITVLAIFDYLGNGAVFDHAGELRLKYNQSEGVVLDKSIGPLSKWKWHSLNDPSEKKTIMVDTNIPEVVPGILKLQNFDIVRKIHINQIVAEGEMLEVEHENFLKAKLKATMPENTFKPFEIKFKTFKINDNFSMHILDQKNISLFYREGKTKLKLNLGMTLDSHKIVDTNAVEFGSVDIAFEHTAKTGPIVRLQNMVNTAKHFERTKIEKQLRLQRPVASLSVDKIVSSSN